MLKTSLEHRAFVVVCLQNSLLAHAILIDWKPPTIKWAAFFYAGEVNGGSAMHDGSQALVIVPIDEDGFHGPWWKQQRHWKQC